MNAKTHRTTRIATSRATALRLRFHHHSFFLLALLLLFGCDSMISPDQPVSTRVELDGAINTVYSSNESAQIVVLSDDVSFARAINDAGIIAGDVRGSDGVQYAVRWTVDDGGNVTGEEALGSIPGEDFAQYVFQEPQAINSSGNVVGSAQNHSDRRVGFVYYESEMKPLPPIYGDTYNWSAAHISDDGVVSGYLEYALRDEYDEVMGRADRGALWFLPYEDDPTLLSPLDQHLESRATHVSQDGIVTGISFTSGESGGYEAWNVVRWELEAGGDFSGPAIIEGSDGYRLASANDAGDVTISQFSEGLGALLRSGTAYDLGPLPGHTTPQPNALINPNSYGLVRIAGNSSIGNDDTRAVYWTVEASGEVGGPVDLGLPGTNYATTRAADINSDGWVAGSSYRKGRAGNVRATLWRPAAVGDDEPPVSDNGPTASFEYSCGNSDECKFTDTSTGQIVDWSWSSGAGHSAEEPNPTFVFSEEGIYTVILEITDVAGLEDAASAEINCSAHHRHGLRCR